MIRAFTFLFSLALVIAFAGCGGDGLVYTGPDDQNPNPPAGNNPGSNYYQLQANINLSREIGHAPLPVNMTAEVKGGKAPFVYRWDVNNDGHWDYFGPQYAEIGIHFASAGLYKILLEVEDSREQSYRANAQIQVMPSGPAAIPTVWPTAGDAPLTVELDGSASYDLDGYIVLYEWDFESDGVYDYESATDGTTDTTYYTQGTYNATLRVTDDDGFQDVATVQAVAL
jgi:PKD repeat protein